MWPKGGVEISDIGFFLLFWVVFGGSKIEVRVFGIILVDFQEFLTGIRRRPLPIRSSAPPPGFGCWPCGPKSPESASVVWVCLARQSAVSCAYLWVWRLPGNATGHRVERKQIPQQGNQSPLGKVNRRNHLIWKCFLNWCNDFGKTLSQVLGFRTASLLWKFPWNFWGRYTHRRRNIDFVFWRRCWDIVPKWLDLTSQLFNVLFFLFCSLATSSYAGLPVPGFGNLVWPIVCGGILNVPDVTY